MATSLIIIGGFLGSGKTTSILAMAKHFLKDGKKIGIVTNDQGSQLVDTEFLASEGLPVLEVTGGCFCCNFDQFTEKVSQLTLDEMPDIILAEPVGSCTDLVATIFKPFQLKNTGQFSLAPLSIIADPKRVRKLMMQGDSNFPDEINYLFQKQLEEADLIVLNKIDLLEEKDINEITDFLKSKYKGIDILCVSAKERTGIDKWANLLHGSAPTLRSIENIDYEVYATAEEYLGWLNSSLLIRSEAEMNLNQVIKKLMGCIRESLQKKNHEIAHLKVYGISEKDWAKASLTGIYEETDFNRVMQGTVREASLVVNARANVDPDTLKEVVEHAVASIFGHEGILVSSMKTESFKPGKPKPKYRIK